MLKQAANELLTQVGPATAGCGHAAVLDPGGRHLARGRTTRPGWLADRIGAVKPGYFADLLVVRGDPASSITATRSIAMVIKSGRIVWHDAAHDV